jgi:hypothetical protein
MSSIILAKMIHGLYALIFRFWRRSRHGWFIRLFCLKDGESLLDVGGTPGFWQRDGTPNLKIVCLNRAALPGWRPVPAASPFCQVVRGDGCHLAFSDRSFAIGFSNSVLEHVGGWARQKAFAAEILRVGRKIWVQTPAFACPIEPHFLAPFFHWLPISWRKRLGRNFTIWGWIERPSQEKVDLMVEEIRLLKKKEVQELFPGCLILTEKLLGVVPKSYIAIRLNS